LPLVFAILGIFVPSRFSKFWAFLGSFVVFVFSLKLYHEYQEMGPAFQLTENLEWIPSLGAKYAVGIDGISLWLVLLTTFFKAVS
jgi:NADH-quinone oxidoreductase subunit M